MENDTERTCWICLSSEGELVNPCRCPEDRVCHKKCLARWQLQSAGKSEEHRCRFCQAVYPSWKDSLTPPHLKPAIPVVSVHYNGICYRLRVKPGPEGFASFQRQLQRITGLPVLDCMQITFQCRAPDTAQELSFKGISAFDAAIHCAAISAAERMATQKAAAGAGRTGTAPASASPISSPTSRGSAREQAEARTASQTSSSSTGSIGPADITAPSSAAQSPLANSASEPARQYRHSTGGDHDVSFPVLWNRREAALALAGDSRLSMDSHRLHRVDSQVVLQDHTEAAQPEHGSAHKHAHRLRRFRDFLRNLFV